MHRIIPYLLALLPIDALAQMEVKTFYQKKVLKEQFTVNDEKHNIKSGRYVMYYPGGTIKIEGQYLNGKKIDYWQFYHSNGSISENGSYHDDLRFGQWRNYFNNGQIEGHGQYNNGVRIGQWKHYYEDGSLREIYDHDLNQKIAITLDNYNFLENLLRYPYQARELGLEDDCVISFEIDDQCRCSEPRISYNHEEFKDALFKLSNDIIIKIQNERHLICYKKTIVIPVKYRVK